MRSIDKLKKPVLLKPGKIIRATPCAKEITNLFNCWRTTKIEAAECSAMAVALTACMTQKGPAPAAASTKEINSWIRKAWQSKTI
ncbi:hypothetical protein HDV03_001681 [Kappamyces sp. JEL0829]|nr:hypothetical protein HDV03_001681 [Kappamyces sp. JEL0829]